MMIPIITTFVFLMAYILVAAWLCRVIMKPVDAHFESGFSLSDSASRLAMICMPFNSSGYAFQWVSGSVTASKVTLECRTKGVKRSFGQFHGRFVLDGDKVALKGKFDMAPGAKMSIIFWLTILVPGVIVVGQKLVVDYTQAMLIFFIFICGLLGFIIWVTKVRISEYPDEVKFISANIKSTLRAI